MRRALLPMLCLAVGCATPPPPAKTPPPFRINQLDEARRDKLAPKLRAALDATGIPVTAPHLAFAQIIGHTTRAELDEATALGLTVEGVTVAAERDMWTVSMPAERFPSLLGLGFVVRLDESRWSSSPLIAASDLVRLDESVRSLLVNTTPSHALTIRLHLDGDLDPAALATLKSLGSLEEASGAFRTMSCALPAMAALHHVTRVELLESTVRKSDANDDWWRKLDAALTRALASSVKADAVKLTGSTSQALDGEMKSALGRLGAGLAIASDRQFTVTLPRTSLRCLAELPFVVSLSQ